MFSPFVHTESVLDLTQSNIIIRLIPLFMSGYPVSFNKEVVYNVGNDYLKKGSKVLLQTLKDINVITALGKQNPKSDKLLDKHPDALHQLMDETSFLVGEVGLRERVYCIINGITEHPTCKQCDSHTTFNYQKKKFNDYCCHRCAWDDPDNVKKSKQTRKRKYGSENYNNRAKSAATNAERYGGPAPCCDPEIAKKVVRTKKENGTDEIARIKRIATNIERYGASTYAASLVDPKVYSILRDPEQLNQWYHGNQLSVTELASQLMVSPTTISRWLKKHNIEVSYNRSFTSIPQKHLTEFVASLLPNDVEIITNTRSIIAPYELDIWIPSLNIAIEYDGVYWHTELQGRDRSYHLNKHQRCKELGIQLIQVWSSDWNLKQDIVQQRLQYKLAKDTITKVYARKCEVVELTIDQQREFFDLFHLQGYAPSRVTYGLKYDDQIVAAMSFGVGRYSEAQYELLRYVCAQRVVGGAQRLLSTFIKQYSPDSIVSYSMNRWNTGRLYEALGFRYSHSTRANYFYVDPLMPDVLLSRVQFQKHKLANKLDLYDPNLSEWQNMINNGYDRIWDCGNDVWLYDHQ